MSNTTKSIKVNNEETRLLNDSEDVETFRVIGISESKKTKESEEGNLIITRRLKLSNLYDEPK